MRRKTQAIKYFKTYEEVLTYLNEIKADSNKAGFEVVITNEKIGFIVSILY